MKLLVLDGNSIVNRAFYGIKTLSTKDGKFTNAIFGFLNILFSLTETYRPEAVAIAFDVHAPTFRHKLYTEYKGNRKGMPEELAQQIPTLKEILKAMGYTLIEKEGWEADDIIGTLAKKSAQNDFCYIATGDRDSLQLVDNKTNVLLSVPKAGKTETVVYNTEKIIEDKGVEPLKLIEVKALMGDSSDNIPGVAGIGEKTATDLIKRYGSIDCIYENFDDIEVTKSVRAKLESGKDSAFLSRTLGTINTEAPIDTDYSSYVLKTQDSGTLKKLLAELEMFKFIEKLGLNDVQTEFESSDNTESAELEFKPMTDSEITARIVEEKELFFICDENRTKIYINLGDAVTETDFEKAIPLFENEEIKKFTFGCKDLYFHCLSNNINIKNISFDILLAAYLLNPNTAEYLISNLSAEYGISVKINSDDKFIKDCAAIKLLYEKLNKLIIESGASELLYDIEIPLAKVLSSMEIEGFKVDFAGIKEYGIMLQNQISLLTEKAFELAGESFNLNSPKQLGVILFEKLSLPCKKKTKTGYSTNADVLESLRDEHPIIPTILEYRTIQKLASTYCDGLLKVVKEDGRIHSTFQQTETRTGRLSSTEPNLQNIPVRQEIGRELRKFFISENGNVLIDADYSQIELRVLAAISGDKNMTDAFNNDEDIHSITASQVFGLPLEMVTPIMRSRAKAVNFGIVYGIGAFSLSKDIGVPVYVAKEYIQNYLGHYSGVDNYMRETVENAKRDGFVTTVFNRRRYLPELSASNAMVRSFGERVARNMPIQGTAADIIKIAMVRVYNRLESEKMNSKLIMQVHDELIIEAPENEKDKAYKILKEEMENAVNLSVKLSTDVHIGKSWYDAKE